MADLRPFRGIRYDLAKVKKLDHVVCQPYDKITDAMREEYYAKSEYNMVRITKGRPKADDSAEDNVYTRARANLDRWLAQGVLTRDEKPAFYVYHQQFEAPGGGTRTRKGFVGTVRLVPFESGGVLPHERTLSKPKADRLNLLRQSMVNFGQIFMLYPDKSNAVYGMLEPFTRGPAELETMEEGSVKHLLWTVSDKDAIDSVVLAMRDKVLFIADGHHRYETALEYMKERKAANPAHTGEEPYNFRMVTLVGMEDPGLVILPTHRLVHSLGGFNPGDFLKRCADFFEVRGVGSLAAAQSEMAKSSVAHAFGVYASREYRVLFSKKGSGWEKLLPQERSEDWRQLDVVVLHQVLIQHLLGIPEEKVTAQTNIRYLRDPKEGIEAVDSGEAQLLLLVNPTRVSQVKAVASKMEKMPQKSTDFYPKLITGLVANPLA
jgi:uncharacterized protein (DUF1015 family)